MYHNYLIIYALVTVSNEFNCIIKVFSDSEITLYYKVRNIVT